MQMPPAPPLEAMISSRTIAAYAGLVPGGLLFVLFLFRRQRYILGWVLAWIAVVGMTGVMSQAVGLIADWPKNAGLSINLMSAALVCGCVFAAMVWYGGIAFRRAAPFPIGTALLIVPLGGALFGLAPFGPRPVLAVGYPVMGVILALASREFVGLARRWRLTGAWMVAGATVPIAVICVLGGVVIGLDYVREGLPNRLLLAVAICGGLMALGMHVLVFEDMTWELRETNQQLGTAQEELRRQAVTDALTGCNNRRFFDEVANRELQQHRRHSIPLSILFIDCDKFKSVNDTLGHEMGDRVLIEVARIVKGAVREADYVFRWGGDEFLVLFSATEEQARAKADAIRAAFRDCELARELPSGVGLSVGCISVPPDTEDFAPLIEQADREMYVRKHGGRGP